MNDGIAMARGLVMPSPPLLTAMELMSCAERGMLLRLVSADMKVFAISLNAQVIGLCQQSQLTGNAALSCTSPGLETTSAANR